MQVIKLNKPIHTSGKKYIPTLKIKSPTISQHVRFLSSVLPANEIRSKKELGELYIYINKNGNLQTIETAICNTLDIIKSKENKLTKSLENHNKWLKKQVKNMPLYYDQKDILVSLSRECKIENNKINNATLSIQINKELTGFDLTSFRLCWDLNRYNPIFKQNEIILHIPHNLTRKDILQDIKQFLDTINTFKSDSMLTKTLNVANIIENEYLKHVNENDTKLLLYIDMNTTPNSPFICNKKQYYRIPHNQQAKDCKIGKINRQYAYNNKLQREEIQKLYIYTSNTSTEIPDHEINELSKDIEDICNSYKKYEETHMSTVDTIINSINNQLGHTMIAEFDKHYVNYLSLINVSQTR
jgi:hypothetical protein